MTRKAASFWLDWFLVWLNGFNAIWAARNGHWWVAGICLLIAGTLLVLRFTEDRER